MYMYMYVVTGYNNTERRLVGWCTWYLNDDQEEEVYIGHPQELLKEVQGYEGENVVLGSHHHIVLRRSNTAK